MGRDIMLRFNPSLIRREAKGETVSSIPGLRLSLETPKNRIFVYQELDQISEWSHRGAGWRYGTERGYTQVEMQQVGKTPILQANVGNSALQ